MKKSLLSICITMVLLVVLVGCNSEKTKVVQDTAAISENREDVLYKLSIQLTDYLNSGNIDAAMAMMNKEMISAMDGELVNVWKQLTDSLGEFVETGAYEYTLSDKYEILEMTLKFKNSNMIQRVVFDSENKISGLRYLKGEVKGEDSLPDTITETPVTVDAGERYPLKGIVTMPKDNAPSAAIVLVHGSGPNNMDSAVGANSIFKDLAHSLEENGIASFRYDKRTYTHGDAIIKSGKSITLNDEVFKDALAAVEVIKSWDGIDSNKVYLLGHSMGGGLLSYINSKGADCAGYIVMAGTPRNIWELIVEQNLMLADEFEKSGDLKKADEIRSLVEKEKLKANKLETLNGEEIVFNLSADYLREFDEIDTIALHLKDELPVLVLQGEKDRQVTMKDYELWKDGLKEHPNTTFISYTKLNHIFGEYTGKDVLVSQMVSVEYAERTPVSDDVIRDITNWIEKLQ
ncbi:alpha/beta fold hydrolase [Miniphocaeibacter massiliensis]|uniref:alpha/beta fold hydrolase n=1 Tax=Miniphocaeibacter massiliensis TaxID=2041841 RepID=UPI000C1C767C|nr:alpha/beta fold hydrolase [Miniphocaeibacter massiliensis]